MCASVDLEVGVGLRSPHLRDVLTTEPDVTWFEVHSCNYLGGGPNRALLGQVADRYPLALHGVNLNLGGVDALASEYLGQLQRLVHELEPVLVSEHLCFTAHNGRHYHDLLPIPYSEEALAHVAARITRVQETLNRQLLIENISRYAQFAESSMTEAEFLSALCAETGCGILLDINNAYINQVNLGLGASEFIAALPSEHIGEVHLAGYSEIDGQLVDTHGTAVCDEVWALYRKFAQLHPHVPTLIEWDSNLPAFSVLLEQAEKAQRILDSVNSLEVHDYGERFASV